MMYQRGSGLIEILVAAAIAVGVALGLTAFFLATLRVGKDVDAQAALQRQGGAIADELGRQLRLVDGSPKVEDPASPPDTPVCLPLTATPSPASTTNDPVLVIPNAAGPVTCYYRDTSTPPQLRRCTRPTPADDCAPPANLLSGSLVPLFAPAWTVSVVTPCGALNGTCQGTPTVCSVAGESCAVIPGASITFTVSTGINLSETFGVAIVANRH
jgi:type II secretory pathway pseudopilin PulG